jgi:hypothetical protein
MSQCLAEDRDIVERFPTAFYVSPKYPEEPSPHRVKGRPRVKSTSKDKVVADLRKQLDTAIFRLLVTAQSRKEFREIRDELFPKFLELSSAISTLIPLPKGDLSAIAAKIFANIAARFTADDSLLPQIEGAREEAQFSLQTLHRAHFLAEDVRDGLKSGSLPPESQKAYAAAISQEWWSILHLRCVSFAIGHKISPTVEVLACLLEGFRHSVMSYACAREAIEPRYQSDYATVDFSSLTPDEGDYASVQ